MTQLALTKPIRTLPFSGGVAGNIKVEITPMTTALTRRWHRWVQPLISKNYTSAPLRPHPSAPPVTGSGATQQMQIGLRTRADVPWDWRHLFAIAQLYSVINVTRPALALSMVVDTGATGPFPIGMLTLVPKLQSTVLGAKRDRSFAWYLADAPSELYSTHLKCPRVAGVAAALLDCTIQAAVDMGEDGTLLLHSDPNGGVRLRDFYSKACGMVQLPPNGPPITPVLRRGRTEEYFHFDAVQAHAFCKLYDPRR